MSEKNKLNIPGLVKGVACSLVLTFIFIILIAAACYFFNVGDKLLSLSVLTAEGLSIFLSAWFVSKSSKQKGLLHGLCIAVGYMLILTLSGIAISKNICTDFNFFSEIICMLGIGALGGILGIR